MVGMRKPINPTTLGPQAHRTLHSVARVRLKLARTHPFGAVAGRSGPQTAQTNPKRCRTSWRSMPSGSDALPWAMLCTWDILAMEDPIRGLLWHMSDTFCHPLSVTISLNRVLYVVVVVVESLRSRSEADKKTSSDDHEAMTR